MGEKVSRLEKVLEENIRHTNLGFAKVHEALIELKREMGDFKDEMRDFKDEMREFKDDSQKSRADLNRKWGDLANRLGTVVEDIVAPNIPQLGQKYFGCPAEPLDFSVRRKRKHGQDHKRVREVDVIAVYPDTVIINETKSTARVDYINDFLKFIPEYFDFFPEHRGKKLIPIFASLYLDESLVNYLTKNGIFAMALKGETMDILNFAELETR